MQESSSANKETEKVEKATSKVNFISRERRKRRIIKLVPYVKNVNIKDFNKAQIDNISVSESAPDLSEVNDMSSVATSDTENFSDAEIRSDDTIFKPTAYTNSVNSEKTLISPSQVSPFTQSEKTLINIANINFSKVPEKSHFKPQLLDKLNKMAEGPVLTNEDYFNLESNQIPSTSRINSPNSQMEVNSNDDLNRTDFYDTIQYPFLPPKKTRRTTYVNSQLQKTPQTQTKNYWGVLEDKNPPNENPSNQTVKTTPNKQNIPPKIPPIIINGKLQDYNSFVSGIKSTLGHNNFHISFNAKNVKILTKDKSDHNKICSRLQTDGKNFHTFGFRDEKLKKLILKAAPNMKPDSIKSDLEEYDEVHVENVYPLTGKNPITFSYLVSFKANTNLKAVFQIQSLGHLRIKWEQYVKKNNYVQCFRCQNFGHTQTYCGTTPKCVKCAGEHLTINCSYIDKMEKPKCSNCHGPHTANHTQCPALIKYLEGRDNYIQTKNPKTEKRQIQQKPVQKEYAKVTDGLSYAEIAQSKNTYTRKPHNSQENQTETEDFNTLLKEIKELNQMCNIRQMIDTVRKIKTELSSATSTLDKLNIFAKYADSV